MLKLNTEVKEIIDNVLMQYHIFDISQPLMITFPPVCQSIKNNDDVISAPVWSFDFFAKRKLNIVAFNHIGEGNYFDSRTFVSFLDKLKQAITVFPSKVGYGSSLGAFSLGLHADRLGLSKVLLMMPQSTYCKKTAPWDSIVINAQDSINSDMAILDGRTCKTPITFIYDPLSLPDKLHVDRYQQRGTRLKIFGVGHRIPRTLQHLDMLSDVILQFRVGTIDNNSFYRGLKERRKLSYYFRDAYKQPTMSYTNRRVLIIYWHKTKQRLQHLKFEPSKILARLICSIKKRIS
ncbi:hypothetical protein EGC82_12025 [Shewanella livingstonensis]|uniref:Alpha/beta hydrolase n=1 Tax=Shewanella livingstonensis TaxID=150120 RepID=A0A3G8LW97_9GAMM|nr:hypothetical protein [Shewanella livingstonensis]AZG73425.1 hypothetical protein EGC82_12025 [Shewanella livingstonensis]